MNIRILKMCRRSPLRGNNIRVVSGLGQLQPVMFSIDRGGVPAFRCEDAQNGRACLVKLPLPNHKARAKALFAELEHHKANGTRTAAWLAHMGTGQ